MSDREQWDRAVAAVTEEYASLPPACLRFVEERAAAIRARKTYLQALFHGVGGGDICAACRGECCAGGKNHFTVIDLLVHLSAGEPLFSPVFGRDLCPGLGPGGCYMAPEFRPFNCITFHCEQIEDLLPPPERERFYLLERELRDLCGEVEEFFANRFAHGLLTTWERGLAEGKPILRHRQEVIQTAAKG